MSMKLYYEPIKIDRSKREMFIIDESILNKAVREGIKRLLDEELSISSEVADKSREIENLIIEDLKSRDKEIISDGVIKMEGSIVCDLFGEEFTVIYCLQSFRYYETFYKNIKNVNLECNSSYDEKKIIINFISLEGVIQENSFSDSIQHEVEHMFQAIKQKRALFDENSLYAFATKNLNSELCNGWVSKLANIIYYSSNVEHSGVLNGLYAQLIKKEYETDEEYLVKSSMAYKMVRLLKRLEYELKENFYDSDFLKAVRFFNGKKEDGTNYTKRTRGWYINKCVIGYTNLSKKIMKIITKARKDSLIQ